MRRATVPMLVCLVAHLALPAVALTAAASPSNDVARLTGPLASVQAGYLPPRTGGDLFGRAAPDGPRPLPLASAPAAAPLHSAPARPGQAVGRPAAPLAATRPAAGRRRSARRTTQVDLIRML